MRRWDFGGAITRRGGYSVAASHTLHHPFAETPTFRGSMESLAEIEPVRYTVHMKAMTYTAARETLARTIERVCEDHDPVIITKRRDQAVVMMSLEDYQSLEETAYLLRSPKNARRLRQAVEQLRAGAGSERELPDPA